LNEGHPFMEGISAVVLQRDDNLAGFVDIATLSMLYDRKERAGFVRRRLWVCGLAGLCGEGLGERPSGDSIASSPKGPTKKTATKKQ